MMNEEIPEYVTHLPNGNSKTLCGLDWFGYTFTGIEHAIQHYKNQGRLLTCRECLTEYIISKDSELQKIKPVGDI